MVFLIIVICVFVLFIIGFLISRLVKKNNKGHEIHVSGGADIERGYISNDNNFFKGMSGDIKRTRVIGDNVGISHVMTLGVTLHNLNTQKADYISVSGDVIIGRSQGDGIYTIYGDGSISGRHCKLFVQKGLLKVQDLNSSNHTFVNGKMVYEAVLQSNDILKLGRTQLRVTF